MSNFTTGSFRNIGFGSNKVVYFSSNVSSPFKGKIQYNSTNGTIDSFSVQSFPSNDGQYVLEGVTSNSTVYGLTRFTCFGGTSVEFTFPSTSASPNINDLSAIGSSITVQIKYVGGSAQSTYGAQLTVISQSDYGTDPNLVFSSPSEISGYSASSVIGHIIIPEGVTAIGQSAFQNKTSLQSLSFPSTLTSIAYYAFSGCTSLTSLTFPEGLLNISSGAFYGCTGLTSVTLPKTLQTLGGAFKDCSALSSLTISSGDLIQVDEDCFSGTALINPPDNPGKLVYQAGSNDTIVTGHNGDVNGLLIIPRKVVQLGANAFAYKSSLQQILLPQGITSIPNFAFRNTGLTSITIPSSVTSIGAGSFQYTSSLTSMIVEGTLTSIASDAFTGSALNPIPVVGVTDPSTGSTGSSGGTGSTGSSGGTGSTGSSGGTGSTGSSGGMSGNTGINNMSQVTATYSTSTGEIVVSNIGNRTIFVVNYVLKEGQIVYYNDPTGATLMTGTHGSMVSGSIGLVGSDGVYALPNENAFGGDNVYNFNPADIVGGTLRITTSGDNGPEVFEPIITSSGGGGGGASGVALAFKYVHGDTATQDVRITVYGEQAPAISADEEVVVNVPLDALKNLVLFTPGATGSPMIDIQGESLQYPNIQLDVSAVLDNRKAGLKGALTSRVRTGVFSDDASNTPHTLSHHLYNSTTYTASILDTSIPVAAIKKQDPQAVLIADLDVTITDVSVTGGQAADTADAKKKALSTLFEEAIAQGRVTTEDASPNLDLAVGDSITLYVRYDLAQKRRYAADDSVVLDSGSQTVTLTFGGKTFDITFENEDDDAAEVGTGSKLYALKFVASASGSVFASGA